VAEGFEEVTLGVGFAGAIHGFQIGAGGDIDDGHRTALLEAEGGFDAIGGAVEVDVHQHEVWAEIIEEPNGVIAGGASAHDTISEVVQKRGHVTADETFVLDD
jgi:hypothetical protein